MPANCRRPGWFVVTVAALWLAAAFGCSGRGAPEGGAGGGRAGGGTGAGGTGAAGTGAGGAVGAGGSAGVRGGSAGTTGAGGVAGAAGGAPGTGGGTSGPSGSYAPLSLDVGWKFIRQDVAGAQATTFDDSAWTTVSTPHTYNDVDSYTALINHDSGDTASFTGPVWYRKHFKIASQYAAGKVIVELERIKQGARFYINGTQVGIYDDGVTACGVDLTGKVNFGASENVLAVRVDNSNDYVETATGVGFEWMGKAFNPNYGGLVGHVWLHLPGKLYQTYPLYNNLLTSGIYIYPSGFANVTASQGDLTVNVESETRNETGAAQTVTLSARVVDPTNGAAVATFAGTPTVIADGQTVVLKASGALRAAKLWSDVTPSLYAVTTEITAGGAVADSRTTVTGFRQAEFRGGIGTGGLYVNGRFVYLLGFAQRATND